MPFQVLAPAATTITTARTWRKRFISQNGDDVQLGGDPTSVRPLGIVTAAERAPIGDGSRVLLTVAGDGEDAFLDIGGAVDVSATNLISAVTATGKGKTAASDDYVGAKVLDTTAGDLADGNTVAVRVHIPINVLA